MYKKYFASGLASGLIIGGACIYLLTNYHINNQFSIDNNIFYCI